MTLRQSITGLLLLLLLAAATAGFLWTAPPVSGPRDNHLLLSRNKTTQPDQSPVDQSPLDTAQRLSSLASTSEEQQISRETQKVSDHEVDLAFEDALRAAAESNPKLTADQKALFDRKAAAEAALKAEQQNVERLTHSLAAAPESQKENIADQLAVAKGQFDLDHDELDDAAEDLERSGADPQARVKRLLAEHEAGHGPPTPAAPVENQTPPTLLAAVHAWRIQSSKVAQINRARQEALDAIVRLNLQHEEFGKHVLADADGRQAAIAQAAGFSRRQTLASRDESKTAAQSALDSLKHHAEGQRTLADLGKRIHDQQELGDLYGSWLALVTDYQRAALHSILLHLLWILIVILLVWLAISISNRWFERMNAENRRIGTLSGVSRFALRFLGALAIIFIVVGMPSQATTILGLAGAGLTVAMKDFIVAFFGWFVLMGRNGVRVGDWVEIEGVAGEVAEIGLLKTVLLETGNWTDSGHPTGRRVSFVNSYAIEGHFFNFTTSGQWMWDELEITIPASDNPYAIIDALQKLVAQETEKSAKLAEAEWQSATHSYRVQAFSAAPAINVRPAGSGVEVRARYITRAYERHETRKHLYEAVIELMHGKRDGPA